MQDLILNYYACTCIDFLKKGTMYQELLKILHSHLSESEKNIFEELNPGWTVKSADCLLITF